MGAPPSDQCNLYATSQFVPQVRTSDALWIRSLHAEHASSCLTRAVGFVARRKERLALRSSNGRWVAWHRPVGTRKRRPGARSFEGDYARRIELRAGAPA